MGAWIEICEVGYDDGSYHKSHPTMGAWIEIAKRIGYEMNDIVAPHDGCVD